MGTYKIRALSILAQNGINAFTTDGVGGQTTGIAPSNAELLAIINALTPAIPGEEWWFGTIGDFLPGDILLQPDSAGIFLDGASVPTAYASLPPGFAVDNGRIVGSVNAALLTSLGADGTEQYYLKVGGIESGDKTAFFDIPNVPPLTLDVILAQQYGCRWVTGDNLVPASSGLLIAGPIYISGTYELSGFSWSLGDSRTHVRAGSPVTIESTGDTETGPDLLDVENIHLTWDDGGPQELIIPVEDFITWTSILIMFYWPDEIPEDTVVMIIPTMFGGSVTLGSLTVVIANASGIYKLDPTLTHDKLYINSVENPTITENVNIPDPFGKTGFIGG